MNETYDSDLFDKQLLNDVTVEGFAYGQLEPWMVLRPLSIHDYDKDILQLLSQLTSVGCVSRTDFENRFKLMRKTGNYLITVIEDVRSAKIIATATLFLELKLIHECAIRGRLEDVVVSDLYRGRQLGKIIVQVVTKLSRKLGCYKITLDCRDNLIRFYESLGYRMEPGNSNSLVIRYDRNKSGPNMKHEAGSTNGTVSKL